MPPPSGQAAPPEVAQPAQRAQGEATPSVPAPQWRAGQPGGRAAAAAALEAVLQGLDDLEVAAVQHGAGAGGLRAEARVLAHLGLLAARGRAPLLRGRGQVREVQHLLARRSGGGGGGGRGLGAGARGG
eukprot:CAMPEP_0194672364 /NCGR_PEP_ID=MMETSP0295-20121207/6398_1 /TAXON_ID=39354 /ORGANISM="Heterosigma akashiwo, Strain CCMP2393" /LENGTH=128 /DNA_ID=CAMNT_0039556053 /DNA_START=378 /DNA_END=762 /DNA_ORIENTATION=-